eukprot:SAG31_NODE_7020_length_1814_cov_1.844315_2_plen_185_part_01
MLRARRAEDFVAQDIGAGSAVATATSLDAVGNLRLAEAEVEAGRVDVQVLRSLVQPDGRAWGAFDTVLSGLLGAATTALHRWAYAYSARKLHLNAALRAAIFKHQCWNHPNLTILGDEGDKSGAMRQVLADRELTAARAAHASGRRRTARAASLRRRCCCSLSRPRRNKVRGCVGRRRQKRPAPP